MHRPFPSIFSSVWTIDNTNTTLVVVVNCVSLPQPVGFVVNMADYGYPDALSMDFTINTVNPDGTRSYYGGFEYGIFVYNDMMDARSLMMLEISPVA